MLGFKTFEINDTTILSRIRLLYRVPHLRNCVLLTVLNLLLSEIRNLKQHEEQYTDTFERCSYKSNQTLPGMNKVISFNKANKRDLSDL